MDPPPCLAFGFVVIDKAGLDAGIFAQPASRRLEKGIPYFVILVYPVIDGRSRLFITGCLIAAPLRRMRRCSRLSPQGCRFLLRYSK
jgi:hypothetical protein